MKIKSLDLGAQPLLLAPMEDVTDLAFRRRCREFGASLVYTEFVSADALVRSIPSTMRKLTIDPAERPSVIQIYGRDAETMAEAAQRACEWEPDLLDLNFGCPVKRVAGKGAGAGLLRQIPLLLEITEAVIRAVDIPVTVKTRLGWDASEIVIGTLTRRLQEIGVAAVTIHGRTRSQMYTGKADWEPIRQVCEDPLVHIPIIGNGDVTTAEQAKQRFEENKVDAVMVGRGAIGRPWVFERMRRLLDKKPLPIHDYGWYLNILAEMVKESVARNGERGGIIHMRRHLAATPIFKGIPEFKQHRIALLRAETEAEVIDLLEQIPTRFDISGIDLSSPHI